MYEEELKEFLPTPVVEFDGKKYYKNYNLKHTIGQIKAFYGNFSVLVKAYAYILLCGKNLKLATEDAVLNANYIKEKLKNYYKTPYDEPCMHEFVISADKQKEEFEVTALNIAKRLMDYDIHPPTIYFPLIVHEAMMIEPTESETKHVLDNFIDVMIKIAQEAKENSDKVKNAPSTTIVKKIDETLAARKPDLSFKG